jgi:hypothetical protein
MNPYRTPGRSGFDTPEPAKLTNTIGGMHTLTPVTDLTTEVLLAFKRYNPELSFERHEGVASFGIHPKLTIRLGSDSEYVTLEPDTESAIDAIKRGIDALLERARVAKAPRFAGKFRKWGR